MGEIMQRMQVYEIASLRGCNPDRIFESEIEEIFMETVDRLPDMTREFSRQAASMARPTEKLPRTTGSQCAR